ncbi:hypothetical protein ACW9HQ_47675 [Nocardia gipuzkoensis]
MSELAAAAASGDRLKTLRALLNRLIASLDEASPGVIPQYAKQISDLSREIAELEPPKREATDIDSFREEFASLIRAPEDDDGKPPD